MFVRNVALLALGASAVVASPLNKRQASSAASSVASSVASGASSAVASATSGASSASQSVSGSAAVTDSAASTSVNVTPTSSAASSASSALSSAVSSAASASSSSTGTTNTSTPESLAFGCPEGYSLTYVIGVAPYADVPIEEAYTALENWGTAIPPPIESVNSTGSGEGAERSWSLSTGQVNLTVSEVLIRVNETPSTFLEQEWNLSKPIEAGSVTISNYTNVLTLYSNSTNNETTVQLFSNFCVNDQAAGLQLYSQLAVLYLQGLQTLFTNGTSSANMTMTGASSSAASGTSSVASGASSAASAASSGASGALGTASSAVGGAISTATGGAASVATSLLGAATSA